jgi:hypothetical protein
MKVEIPDLTGAECGDIAITAAEGGIGYWSQLDSYDWQRWAADTNPNGMNKEVADDFVFYTIRDDPGLGFAVQDDGTYKGAPVDVTPTLIRLGFERMSQAPADKGGWPFARLLAIAREDWTGEIDADIADAIIQFGVFGEIRYG